MALPATAGGFSAARPGAPRDRGCVGARQARRDDQRARQRDRRRQRDEPDGPRAHLSPSSSPIARGRTAGRFAPAHLWL